jgi:hypothetical protein
MWNRGDVTTKCGLTLSGFSPSDPPRIQARADFAAEQKAAGDPLMGPDTPGGLCWTLKAGPGRRDRPLACGGIEDMGHGRWSAWLYAGDLSPRGWAMVARGFRMMRTHVGARRVEMNVRAPVAATDWALFFRAHSFARALGMEREGLMRGWGPDRRDYYLYAGIYR